MKKKKFDGIIVSVRFSKEQIKGLQKVCKHYRTDGKLSQGIRRAVEDLALLITNSNSLEYQLTIAREEVPKSEHPSDESSSTTING